MIIMHMHYIGLMVPFIQPLQYSNLKCGEPFGIIIITIYFLLGIYFWCNKSCAQVTVVCGTA